MNTINNAGFLKMRPERRHDAEIGSVSLHAVEAVPRAKFEAWLQSTVAAHDLLRFKGVVNVKEDNNRYRSGPISPSPSRLFLSALCLSPLPFVVTNDACRHCFQGVSRLYSLAPQKSWGDERRLTRMVFIGRHLDKNGAFVPLYSQSLTHSCSSHCVVHQRCRRGCNGTRSASTGLALLQLHVPLPRHHPHVPTRRGASSHALACFL